MQGLKSLISTLNNKITERLWNDEEDQTGPIILHKKTLLQAMMITPLKPYTY
jgi:hypothetical protein